jgi:hypothetical protein
VWITSDVSLPQAILDAQSQGRLVLFVGAGASVDAPSGLPLFDELARQLAEMARVPFPKSVALDYFLGSMPEGFDTHRHARDLITRDGSAPNTTHGALVRVASSVGQLRIVTTNFDNHLSSAAAALEIEPPDMWTGPALPLGHDFTGIVHLHGSMLRDPRELVLTDGDFGRAYLTNAWATRFLLPMFQRFTVLFIGYSHEDPIMRYLALGLPSRTPRYAFTSANDVSDLKWARLGIETIGYPVLGHDHTALVVALEAWDLRARMGQTEHRARMAEIICGGPTLTPVDYDYLVGRLETSDGALEFAEETAAVETNLQVGWLHWAESLSEFKALFTGQGGDSASAILGNWFCRSFIAVPELHGAALQTVQRLGQTFGQSFFAAAGLAAEDLSKVEADAGRRWKAFLATSVHGHSAPVSTETLLPYLPGEHPEDLTVLRAVLRPYLVLKRRWSFGGSEDLTTVPDAEVHWKTDADSLIGHVLNAVETAASGDLALGIALEDSLGTAYALLDAYHSQRDWDPLSFGRAAVEPHEQDEFRESVDAIIDGLRAYGEKALPTRSELPERWWALDRALFRRLALHLLALDTSRTADEKIAWVLDRSMLYETDFKHEVYRVLAVVAGEASKEARDPLLAAAQAGPEFPEDIPERERHTAYATYNLLIWLAQVAPEWSEAGAALAAAQAANPSFDPRQHPDLDSWMTSGTWGGKLPMEPEDFIASFEKDPPAATYDLLSRDYSERSFDKPEWRDALSLVSRVAESRPDIGELFWAHIDKRTDLKERADDLHRATIEGWSKASLGDVADAVVADVATHVRNPDSARSVSRFLLDQVGMQIESDETPALAAMRRIALDLWLEHAHSFAHSEGADPSSFAPLYLNSWPGDLARYWISEVDRRWRKHRNEWSGLSDDERGALTQLLEGPPHALDAIGPALAVHLYFIFAADEAFATRHVLPLFQEDTTAARAWNAYLHNPRCNDKLLAAGLLDSTISEWGRLDALGERGLRSQFFGLVTSIVSFAGITPEARRALLDQSVLANDGAHAAEFAHTVARFLGGDGIDGAEVWKRWLRDHLSARLNGVPRRLDMEELKSWADAVPYLGEGIPEASVLLSNRSIGLDGRIFKWDFPEEALSAHGSILVSHFAERIRHTSPSNRLGGYKVKKLIDALRGSLGDVGVQPLMDAAAEKGFYGHIADG